MKKIQDAFDRGDCALTFGDNVVVLSNPDTNAAGIAGATAQIVGETTPSITGVTVIGKPKHDYAIALDNKEWKSEVWIDPRLVQFVDHGPGTTIELQGVPTVFTRDASGEWEESRVGLFARLKRWFRKKRR